MIQIFRECIFTVTGSKVLKRLLLSLNGCLFLFGVFFAPSMVAAPLREWQELSSSLLWEGTAGVHRGIAFLLAEQEPDGSWKDDPASTAFALLALNHGSGLTPLSVENAIDQGQKYLISWIGKSGFQDRNGDFYTNEAVAAVILALLRRNNDDVRRQAIHRAREYLLTQQNMGVPEEDWRYGGFPAVFGGEPELMTTQWALEAILATDFLAAESQKVNFSVVEEKMGQRYQAALLFIKRCQWFVADIPVREKGCAQTLFGAFFPMPMAISNEHSPLKNNLITDSLRLQTLAGLKVLVNVRGTERKEERLQTAIDWLWENWQEASWFRAEGKKVYKEIFFLNKVLYMLEPLHPNVLMVGEQIRQWRVLTAAELLRRQGGEGGWGADRAVGENKYNSVIITAWAILALSCAVGSQ